METQYGQAGAVFTATVTSIGAGNGHTETSNGAIQADQGKPGLAMPETSVRGGLCFLLSRHSTSSQSRGIATPQKPRAPAPSRRVSARRLRHHDQLFNKRTARTGGDSPLWRRCSY